MRHEIYALFDFELNRKKGYCLEKFLELPKVRKATILQYRDKINPLDVKLKNALYFKKFFKGKVLANDDLRVALEVDGLHVGQEDLLRYETDALKSVKWLKNELKDKILGLSTHNIREIEVANTLPLNYIGLGAYRDTSTKSVNNILGESLSALAKRSKHAVAAIGGVKSGDKIDHVAYLVLGSDLYEN